MADTESFPAQLLPRALSCAVLLLLLATVLGRGWRCSIARILRQYRAVIFHEIQNLVSGERGGIIEPFGLEGTLSVTRGCARCR